MHSAPEFDLEIFKKQGFALVRNVFTPEEIARWRSMGEAELAKAEQKGIVEYFKPGDSSRARFYLSDIMGIPGLNEIVIDPRILALARQALGGTPVYFSDGSFQMGEGGKGFHRDNKDRTDFSAPDWSEAEYPIIRFGVYMQDHDRYSGGLKVIPGSHQLNGVQNKKAYFVPSRAGDVVFWSLRTLHSGNVVKLKGLGFVDMNSSIEKRVPHWLRVAEQKSRMACFFSFGREHPLLERYYQFLLTEQKYFTTNLRNTELSKAYLERLESLPMKRLPLVEQAGGKIVP